MPLKAGADYNRKERTQDEHRRGCPAGFSARIPQTGTVLPRLPFTGNKFEFRMLGSSLNIACPNLMLNTMVAEELAEFADQLENSTDFEKALHDLVVKTYTEHKRIIFNGNNYSDEWVAEAEKRGLYNLRTTADALPLLCGSEKHRSVYQTPYLHQGRNVFPV